MFIQKKNLFFIEAISYNNSSTLDLEYSLNNDNWATLKGNEFEYENYVPGNYEIIFRAKKQGSSWINSKNYAFVVSTLWYKKWWTLALLVFIVFILILTLINRQRIKSKKRNLLLLNEIDKRIKLESELITVRDNIAQDFHDDLGNKLARISIFSELLLKDKKIKNKKTVDRIHQIILDSEYLFRGTRDFIFSLKSGSDKLDEIVIYLIDFTEEYCRKFDIKFSVIKEIDKNIELPYYWSKQLIYIFKEAITNAIKHSKCKNLVMEFYCAENQLKFTCTDNGIGFKEEKLSRKSGLKNMRIRTKKIGCRLDVKSIPEEGTVIGFYGELPK